MLFFGGQPVDKYGYNNIQIIHKNTVLPSGGKAMKRLYVEDVTNEASPNYIPEADRISGDLYER